MSWMEKLYQTYEAVMALDLPIEEGKQPLMPTSHTLQNAHINIVIDGEGNFRRASVLEKTQIILPATEKSAGRTGKKPPPHPLADKLQYVAKDYPQYGGKKVSFFDEYYALLQCWCNSKHSHPKANAVFNYISKGNVIKDLSENGILIVENGQLATPKKFEDAKEKPAIFKVIPKDTTLDAFEQGAALICWSVEINGDPISDTWKDKSLQDMWIEFNSDDEGIDGLCFITGNKVSLASNHPAKIRHSGDKAKLISSNDTSGYTYRGRFLEDNQACGIGFDVSQKAHNALSWLIQRQGFRNGDQAYVAWAVSGKSLPDPFQDSLSMLDNEEPDLSVAEETTSQTPETPVDHAIDLGQSYAQRLRNHMAGYAAQLSPDDQIIIMGIDSATPGRMGIIYYREMLSPEFLDRLETWHQQSAWYQRRTQEIPNDTGKKPKTKVIWPISSPLPKDIAGAAYGDNVTDSLKKKVIERLIPCIIDGQSLPLDLVISCVRRAANRVAYASDEQWLWEKNLGITCALYKGFHHRHPDSNQRRNYAMALEENYHSRDYLYGRLLAIAERIEGIALSISGESRPTTAARLMQRFADRPYETWRTIELALQPYMQRLRVSRAGFLTNRLKELDAILDLFDPTDFTSKAPLSGEFLLGYHCQRQHAKNKSENPDTNESSGDEA